jgi:hypothetical protein
MSFLFGKKNKQQSNALPPATREITSSHGQAAPPAALNGAVRDVEKSRPGPQSQNSTPSASVNNSISSLQNHGNATTPEPKALRERADPNVQVGIFDVLHCLIRAKTDCFNRMQGIWVAPQTPPTRGRPDA